MRAEDGETPLSRKEASYAEEDRFKLGKDYLPGPTPENPSIPAPANIAKEGNGARLSPLGYGMSAWVQACYRLEVAGYDGEKAIYFAWAEDEEPPWGEFWVGLANYDKGSWEWRQGDDGGVDKVSYAGLAHHYLSPAGKMYV
ncbi:hypothetical protein IIA79_07695, partial [bacterium]|nr:hypothetical protein [bacterium]